MVGAQVTRQRVHPILRNPGESEISRSASPTRRSRGFSDTSASPQSQVRFSIPDFQHVDDSQLSISQSPSKIVFPRSSEEDSEYETANESVIAGIKSLGKDGHFMDMHSRVMIEVPEEIWDFHTRRRLGQHRRSRSTGERSVASANDKDEELSRSLQSIIVDTLDSMGKYKERYLAENSDSANTSSISQMSPLNLRNEPKSELYLTTYSPLNHYNVPVPLEISLPPFLSPKNKRKKRSSLIFDGNGYSPFAKDPYEASEEEDMEEPTDSRIYTDTEDELSISDGSIPSAVHDISFDMDSSFNVDEELGIDGEANVNLKIQRKNLRSQSPERKLAQGNRMSSPTAKNPRNDTKKDIHMADHSGEKPHPAKQPEPLKARDSLNILETPVKQINIPDIDFEPTPQASAGSLKFFDSFAEPEVRETLSSPSKKVDHLDMNFKFPLPPPDEDFVQTDTSPTTSSFERRRDRLKQQNTFTPKGRRHTHNRSRSIHGADDMFAVTSTPPAKEVGQSELRQNLPEYLPPVNGEDGEPKYESSPKAKALIGSKNCLPVTPVPIQKHRTNMSATAASPVNCTSDPSNMKLSSTQTPAPFEEHVYEVAITPESEPFGNETDESDGSSVYEDVHAPQEVTYNRVEEQSTFGQENAAFQDQSTYNKTDDSVKILAERRATDHFDFSEEFEEDEMALSTPVKQTTRISSPVTSMRPMTSIQSFNGPVIPPKSDYEQIVSLPVENNKLRYNVLSPRRSLSNLGSQSSKNSEFSKQTNQSSRTSYPMERELVNPLVSRLKKSDNPHCFDYSLIPKSDAPAETGNEFVPSYDECDNSLPSIRRQLGRGRLPLIQKRLAEEPNLPTSDISKGKTTDQTFVGPMNAPSNSMIDVCAEDQSNVVSRKKSDVNVVHESHLKLKTIESPENDYGGKQIMNSKTQAAHQNYLRPQSSYPSNVPTKFSGPNDLYGPQNYQMAEDYLRQQLENEPGYTPSYEASDDMASCLHRLAASEDFRDVFETLDNMSPTAYKFAERLYETNGKAIPELEATSEKHPVSDKGYQTEYEIREGKLVEVLVLDDDSTDSTQSASISTLPRTSTRPSVSSSRNRSHDEILKMCEDTASHAKSVIMQLVEQKKQKLEQTKKSSRPAPPTLNELQPPVRSPKRQAVYHSGMSDKGQERYLKNLNRTLRPRPIS